MSDFHKSKFGEKGIEYNSRQNKRLQNSLQELDTSSAAIHQHPVFS